jgi:hypothetical protein
MTQKHRDQSNGAAAEMSRKLGCLFFYVLRHIQKRCIFSVPAEIEQLQVVRQTSFVMANHAEKGHDPCLANEKYRAFRDVAAVQQSSCHPIKDLLSCHESLLCL